MHHANRIKESDPRKPDQILWIIPVIEQIRHRDLEKIHPQQKSKRIDKHKPKRSMKYFGRKPFICRKPEIGRFKTKSQYNIDKSHQRVKLCEFRKFICFDLPGVQR